MSKRKLAYIVSMAAGLEAFIYREIEELERLGYEILLCATQYTQNDVFAAKTHWRYSVLSKKGLIFALPRILRSWFSRWGVWREAWRTNSVIDLVAAIYFLPFIKQAGTEQIHAHFGDHKLFIAYYCKRLSGLPLSVTIHAHEFYTNPNALLFRIALRNADRIYPIAQKWCDRLIQEYAIPKEKIFLNRLFVDTEVYTPYKPVWVLAAGRFTERKGFHYLIKAAQRLAEENIHFVFVGFGEVDLKQLALEGEVSHKVTVYAKMDQAQLRFMYQRADILCVPSITTEREGAEGIPVVLMEGMACGLPVVATPSGATTELVDEIVVEEHSVDQLAAAILRLAQNPEERRLQGIRNREKVLLLFSKANVEKFARDLDRLV